jgi:hypothetical protein
MAVRVPSAGIHSHIFGFTITQLSPVGALHAVKRKRAVLALLEDIMKLTGISSYPRRKGDA